MFHEWVYPLSELPGLQALNVFRYITFRAAYAAITSLLVCFVFGPPLIEWLRRPDNPFFARALVNRVWAHYFGRGIVDPPDDLSPLNPASHPELLDELCRRFVENRYDLKWLHRAILTSGTYQRSSQATAGVDGANRVASIPYSSSSFSKSARSMRLTARWWRRTKSPP